MKILLIGNTGQVGWELQRTLAPLGKVTAVDYPEINFLNTDSIRTWTRRIQPQVIVNAAAYTDVDGAETDEEIAQAINGTAPGILAEEAKALGAALFHYSTDFVYDGKKAKPYTEDDPTNPLSVYGQTKLNGDEAIQQFDDAYLIMRTSWVYSTRCSSFVTKVLAWSREHTTLRIVDDQVGSPTWCRMLAEITAQVLAMGDKNIVPWLRERRGIYHLGGSGAVSRFEWAKAILACDPHREEQIVQSVVPAKSTEFPTPAERPVYSALGCEQFVETFDIGLPDWKYALELALADTAPT